MFGVLKELKSWVRVGHRPPDHVCVDTIVSALHHRVTSVILLLSCTLVTSRQYFGDPVLCIQDGADDAAIPSNVLNTYCFVTSSYTVVGPTGMVLFNTHLPTSYILRSLRLLTYLLTYFMVQDIILKANCHSACQRISYFVMEPSLPCSQKSATGPYPAPAKSSSLFSSCERISPGPRRFETLRNRKNFYGEGLLAPMPNPQAGGPLLVRCPRLLIRYICSYTPYLGAFRPSAT
jgi:hypothetical protein